jgi:hypothetical protein
MTGVRKVAVAGAVVAFLALAAAGQSVAADRTIGETFGNLGTTTPDGCAAPCTWINTTVTPPQVAASPCNGRVDTWSVYTTTAIAQPVRLRVVTDNGGGNSFTATSSSNAEMTPATTGEHAFNTNRQIARGQYVGLDISSDTAFLSRNTGTIAKRTLVGALPDNLPGPTLMTEKALLYNAHVVCTSIPPPISSGDITPITGSSDTVAPRFDTLSESNGVFAPVGVRLSAARVQRGTRFRYRLSEASTVRISIFRIKRGRRVGRRCLRATFRRRHRPRCTRSIKKGTLRAPGKEGRNSKFFSGRIRGTALRRGKYKAVFRATDSAGNKSRRRTLRFRIIRPRLRR